jgi:hypothetical protein
MKKPNKFTHFLRYEGKLLIITFVLIFITGCFSWRTFFRTPEDSEIRKDYLVEDISKNIHINQKRLNQFDETQLEIISRLDLNGLIALEQIPEATNRVYEELKNFQLFYDIVNEYGPQHTIPVLDYFYEESNLSITLEEKLSQFVAKIFEKEIEEDSLTARQKRLLMILSEIHYQKHNFLSRFVFTEKGAKRNYVSTTTSTLVNFFTGGLSNFNAAVVTKGITKVSTEELVDAGIDVVVLIPFAVWFTRSAKSGLRALKGGRTVAVAERTALARGAGTATKTARFSRITNASKGIWKAIPLRTLFRFRYVKWYILGLAIVKPSLINHAAALVAKAVSVPPILIKTGFWFLIFFPILNVLFPLVMFVRYLWRKFKPKISLVTQ